MHYELGDQASVSPLRGAVLKHLLFFLNECNDKSLMPS